MEPIRTGRPSCLARHYTLHALRGVSGKDELNEHPLQWLKLR